jgi:hypothetical protein
MTFHKSDMARQKLMAERYSSFTGSQIVVGEYVTKANEPTAEDCNHSSGGGDGGETVNTCRPKSPISSDFPSLRSRLNTLQMSTVNDPDDIRLSNDLRNVRNVTRTNKSTGEYSNHGSGGGGSSETVKNQIATIIHGSVENIIGIFLAKEKQKNATEKTSVFSSANIII